MRDIKSESRILVVDDELSIRKVLKASLEDENYSVILAKDGAEALRKIRECRPAVVLLDIWMPGEIDGLEVLGKLQEENIDTEVIIMSGHGNIETAVKATKLGAWDFVEKPLSLEKILILIKNILKFQATKKDRATLLNSLQKDIAIIGHSNEMMGLKKQLSAKAGSHENCLLLGGKGVGKKIFAKNLHYLSARSGKPFVFVNLQSASEELIEQELFGQIDAKDSEISNEVNSKSIVPSDVLSSDFDLKGKIEKARTGTLFLHQVEFLEEKTLEKVVNFLQENSDSFDVKLIISATKMNDFLERKFTSDNRIEISNLRERADDIAALISYFSQNYSIKSGCSQKIFSEEAMEALQCYSWPGNVRELRNFIERIYILVQNQIVDIVELELSGMQFTGNISEEEMGDSSSFKNARAKFEKEFLLNKIKENSGNVSQTAKMIGLERSYLHRKIKFYGLDS